MTATPHRGSEWLFRHLLHLVDPEVYPTPAAIRRRRSAVKPGPGPLPPPHEGRPRRLRRSDQAVQGPHGAQLGRSAELGRAAFYDEALDLVDDYFPPRPRPLPAWCTASAPRPPVRARRDAPAPPRPHGHRVTCRGRPPGGPRRRGQAAQDEARVIHEGSKSARAEKKAIGELSADSSHSWPRQAMPSRSGRR